METCWVSSLEPRAIGLLAWLTPMTVHIVADNRSKQAAEHHRHSTKAIVSCCTSKAVCVLVADHIVGVVV